MDGYRLIAEALTASAAESMFTVATVHAMGPPEQQDAMHAINMPQF